MDERRKGVRGRGAGELSESESEAGARENEGESGSGWARERLGGREEKEGWRDGAREGRREGGDLIEGLRRFSLRDGEGDKVLHTRPFSLQERGKEAFSRFHL